uniref:Annexin n=1 Tax=Saccoglossus kowalevskii TaxID=10224 RepID=A0ABM0M1Y3_SACKO|nr:PREDICTED: annexin A7-like isoform X1 [Saccoglossus kowalevskii]XP_006814025.1 PREDICTED: annexin A7-like isoform X2 [Saccoglossus kowalevskii]
MNADGFPALTVAVMNNHVDCIPVLADVGADVNAKSPGRNGNTALHEGVLLGPDGQEAIEALLDCNANCKCKNDRGETPYDLAMKKGYESIAAIFASSMGQSTLNKFSGGKGRRGSRDSAASGSQGGRKRHTYKEKSIKGIGTVTEFPNFDAKKDSEVLRKAMKGFGTDEKSIIAVVSQRSNKQRQKISREFKTMYGKDLIKEFKSEMSGKLLDVILGLMKKPAEFDASELKKAVKGLGTDEDALIEILCTRTNAEILAINDEYERVYKNTLEDDVISDTSGHFRRILVSVIQGNRPEEDEIDPQQAKDDAQALYNAGEKKWGTDESKFNEVMASRSYPQLRATFDEYGKISKKDITQAIKSEMSGDLKNSMLTIVRCVRNKHKYFSDKLYKSMKGAGTDDDALKRIVISRCEVDMVNIKNEFQNDYKKTLGKFIAEDTSGDYKRILLSLVGGES